MGNRRSFARRRTHHDAGYGLCDLLRLLHVQLRRRYGFADVLVARAGTRVTAVGGQAAGRKIEDEIAAIAEDLGLPYVSRSS